MKLENLFYFSAIIFLLQTSCGEGETKRSANSGIKMKLSTNQSAVQLYDIPLNIVEELQADSLSPAQWQDFFAVYAEPSDPEMRDFEQAIVGTYSIRNTMVEFVPTDGFVRGKAYFARCYTKDILETPEDILSKRDLTPTDGFLEFKFQAN